VVAALVADKTYPDPYYGKNLRDIPGTIYPIGKNFSLLAMPKDSPFAARGGIAPNSCFCELQGAARLAALRRNQHHANIWLNGK